VFVVVSVPVVVGVLVVGMLVVQSRETNVTVRHFIPPILRVFDLSMTMECATHEHIQAVLLGVKNDWKGNVKRTLSLSPKVDVVRVRHVVNDKRTWVKARFFLHFMNSLRCMSFRQLVAVVLGSRCLTSEEAERQKKRVKSHAHWWKIRGKSNHELRVLHYSNQFF